MWYLHFEIYFDVHCGLIHLQLVLMACGCPERLGLWELPYSVRTTWDKLSVLASVSFPMALCSCSLVSTMLKTPVSISWWLKILLYCIHCPWKLMIFSFNIKYRSVKGKDGTSYNYKMTVFDLWLHLTIYF